ncbi:putative MPP superfamily phosphohydrolase [Clostridium punense]|uniref:MPP superfamily phosphohydrolase n=1 Tax=Clostridium punense TaxID=1054297 RepID=A0ABS4K893_9CLOT|nr:MULTISPECIES: metallophosphoesterase [Clostridium]EQB89632.1 hypothetical protein M918_19765 [Clostridium sp. BL8]MBP2024003.1 putative MPP superfamily phosphohydrolase [Clostridium punense]
MKFDFRIFIFVLVATVVYILGNYYIGRRVMERIQYKYTVNTKMFWTVFWIIALAYVVNQIAGNYLPRFVSTPILYIGIYYMAIVSYLMLIFPIIDTIRFANKKYAFLPKDSTVYSSFSFYVTIFMAVALTGILVYGTWSGRSTYVKPYDVNVSKALKENNLKIALISDIHLGDYMDIKRLQNLVSEVNKMNPDIVLIAGDLIDSSIKPFVENQMAKELGQLSSKYGTYFSFGNHDLGSKVPQLTSLLEEVGITVLKDEYKLINDSFYVVGRQDVAIKRTGGSRKNLSEITEGIDKSKPVIVIDHNPMNASVKEAQEEKIDLQVSGHTHRGQFVPYNFFTNRGYDYVYGYDRIEDFNVVVSSGYGTWGPPIRIGSRSEIVQINLTSNMELVDKGGSR